ncbi:MAG TPA: hypothetical protein VER33_00045 [Polyangiaceae bacterium]|nr:hypothetical protein [Polyangiaceae bacterium]
MDRVDAAPTDAAFQRAFVAVSYLLGSREPGALAVFPAARSSTRALLAELASDDQAQRAAALGRELAEVARALRERSLA